jgi:hydroxymethylglutaryl-CoA reductase
MPISVGIVGGVIGTNPIYKDNFRLLGNPNSKVTSEIMASVGLANNLSALSV